ncbi:MAG: TIGR03943 family protein [Actinomycetota bacterium]|nr:TIGR03943 family protein [Actinomycetota bacterium]
MRRETANVLLVLLGGALLKIAWNGTYLRYVKPSLLPFLVATGVVIVALGVLAITRDGRRGRPPDTGHEHGGRSPWLLVLPVLAIFLVAPPALGADKVTRSAQTVGAQDRSASDFDALPAGEIAPLPMGEFVTRAVWDSSSLDGRRLRLVGFVVRDADGATSLARLTIACCAADALPVQVRLDGAGAWLAGLPQDSWLQVEGVLVPGSATPANRFVPALAVSAVQPVPAPEQPYEY